MTWEDAMRRGYGALRSGEALYAMPANLHIAQMLILDGISTSIDAINIAYRNLQATLLEFNRSMDQHRPPSRTVTVPAVMNAWAVVDAAYRLGLIVPSSAPEAWPGGEVVPQVRRAGRAVPPCRATDQPRSVAMRSASDCRRRRRGPQVRQERGQAVESIARSASTRPGRTTPP